MRKSYTFLPLWVFLLFSVRASAQNEALNLQSTNYGIVYSDVLSTYGPLTVEFWTYVDSAATPSGYDGFSHQWLSQGSYGSAFYVGYDPNGYISIADFGGSTTTKLPLKRWVHIAVTYDPNSENVYLFVDGALRDSLQFVFFTDGSNQLFFGSYVDGSQPITSKMDEVKIWNTVRTNSQIKADLFTPPSPGDIDLEAWYQMNSTTGTSIMNSAATTGSNLLGYIYGDPSGADSWARSPVVGNLNGLTFDGVDDQVIIPANAAYNIGAAGGTIEFWVKPAAGSLNSTMRTMIGNRGTGGIKYSYHLSSTTIGLETSAGMSTVSTTGMFPGGFPDTGWTHLAFVYNGTSTTTVYVNGVNIGSLMGTYASSAANQDLVLGIARNTNGSQDRPFSGGIDEVRIWSTQRGQMDILNNMAVSLTGLESGLTGEFTFDNGTASADNTGLITALDNSASANHGTLTNFALTGTSSNFALHTAVAPVNLPLVLTKFTAIKRNNNSILQWTTAMEQNTSEFLVQRSTDGENYTTIGVVAAAGNSSTPKNYTFTDMAPDKGSDYYRLKQVDLDARYTYSPICVLNFPLSSQLIWYPIGKSSAEIYLQQGSSEMYMLSDMNGRTLSVGQLSGGKVTLANLTPGIYAVSVRTKAGIMVATEVLIP